MSTILNTIREECRPLFRRVPVRTSSLSTYRPRGGSEQNTEEGTRDSDDEDIESHKLVMVRFPWQPEVPEEKLPMPDAVPCKTVHEWVKGMLRRAFGSDVLATKCLYPQLLGGLPPLGSPAPPPKHDQPCIQEFQ